MVYILTSSPTGIAWSQLSAETRGSAIAGTFLLGGTPGGDRTEQGLCWLGHPLRSLYMEP